MNKITGKTVVNNQYNKTIYAALAGAALTVVFVALSDYGVSISTELQGAITTFTMMLTTLLVKNRDTASG